MYFQLKARFTNQIKSSRCLFRFTDRPAEPLSFNTLILATQVGSDQIAGQIQTKEEIFKVVTPSQHSK